MDEANTKINEVQNGCLESKGASIPLDAPISIIIDMYNLHTTCTEKILSCQLPVVHHLAKRGGLKLTESSRRMIGSWATLNFKGRRGECTLPTNCVSNIVF